MQHDLLVLANDNRVEAIQHQLPAANNHIVMAETAAGAIQWLSEARFDLVLIDPQVDDLYADVIRAAHHTSGPVYLPVILLVDERSSGAILPALEAGADDYIILNCAPGLLEARLMLHIAHSRKLQARDQTIAELVGSRESHNQMLQMVAHDLMHPVSNIHLAEDMLRQSHDEATRRVILDSVQAAVVSLQEGLEDLNAASSIELDSLQFTIEPVAVGELMNRVHTANIGRISSKAMTVELPETALSVMADREKLRRVLENLLTNAIKYSPKGTTITLDASRIDGYVRLSVSDEGPGILSDEAYLLFTRFGRLSTRPTGEETSTGLGLWIVKMLVEAMDGRIGMESEFGQGATFWVELPLESE